MSRIGKLPVAIPEGVQVDISGLKIKVVGKGGSLEKEFAGDIVISLEDNAVKVKPLNDTKPARAMWGTARSIISNMVLGVTTGFKEKLLVKGVGYRAVIKGDFLNLTLGKSHNTKIQIPKDIKLETPKQDIIEMFSIDKEKLGQFIAVIKSQRPPEPYKGKGIRREHEHVIRKEGKKS